MKSHILLLLIAASLIACNGNRSGQNSYTPEFTGTFIKEKNSFIAQRNLMTAEAERLNMRGLEMVQGGPAFMPFAVEMVRMKRTNEAAMAALNSDFMKLNMLNDEILERKKPQADLEQEWTGLKRSLKGSMDALHNMNAENENRFREFMSRASGHPMPTGPIMQH